MKVVENKEEPFKKDIGTNYIDEDTYYIRNAYDKECKETVILPNPVVVTAAVTYCCCCY